jgi:cystathionine beta-lyase/cystathionine gamma-synthase
MYSATKYLSGFSDMIGGVLLAKDPDLIRQIRPKRSLFGTILQPDECWMLDGRLSTVGLRMGRATENAQHIAAALAGHRKLECVVFPTLFEDAEQKRIVEKQCDQPGAMLSLVIKGGCARFALLGTRFRWGGWRPWFAIPRRLRILGLLRKNSGRRVWWTGW